MNGLNTLGEDVEYMTCERGSGYKVLTATFCPIVGLNKRTWVINKVSGSYWELTKIY